MIRILDRQLRGDRIEGRSLDCLGFDQESVLTVRQLSRQIMARRESIRHGKEIAARDSTRRGATGPQEINGATFVT